MKKLFYALCALVLLALLSACGPQSSATTSAPVATTTPMPTATPIPKLKTAADIMTALKTQGLPIGETFTYDENTDLNKLLGRPGQYTSKVEWKDTRVTYSNNTGAEIAVRDGGSIEVCDTLTDAKNRFKYVDELSRSVSLLSEYDYLEGTAILRVSSDLTPTQAKAYEATFKQIMA